MDSFKSLYHTILGIASNPKHSRWLHPLLLLADAGLTALVIKKISYTEIDFSTYMQQVQYFIWGVRDYKYLEGSTGPLVYPALHVYIYSFLWWICKQGLHIFRAQIMFGALYIFGLDRVITAYRRAGAPPYLLPLLVLSKRLHSIFVLRLFNDCFAAIFLWLAILAYQNKRWILGSFVFSLGVGVKMTLLLALPGIMVVLGTALPVWHAVEALGAMWGVQVIIAVPFIQKNAETYMSRAFEFSRQFLFKWTVNWRFVGEKTFLSKGFSESLLTIHALLLVIFVLTRWLRPSGLSVFGHIKRVFQPLPANVQNHLAKKLDPSTIMTFILTSLAVGMLCARSLHYQFFAYLAWASPYLWWKAGFHPILIYGLWALQEWAWNVYPSTNASSRVVVASLAIQVVGIWWGTRREFVEGATNNKSRKAVEGKKTK